MGTADSSEDQSSRAVRRLLLATMAVGFLALIAAGWAAWRSTERNQRYTALVQHTYQVQNEVNRFQAALEQSETARRGFLLTGRPLFSDAYARTSATLQPALDAVDRLTRDNPVQQRNLALVRAQTSRLAGERAASMAIALAGGLEPARALFAEDASVPRIRAVRARVNVMLAAESRLLSVRAREQAASASTFLAVLIGAGVLVVIVALVSLLTVTRYTRDLDRSQRELRRLNESLEDQVRERTADLSRANDEIQRFAYIVSHDLRSPLVNVMGFTAEMEGGTRTLAELVDRAEAEAPAILTEDARLAAREDLPEALGFIRTSTAKMDRLINAILKLSREGRRVITPEPVSMGRVIDTVRDTLQHRLAEREAEVLVPVALPGITSDRLAIEQVFGNVIENAVKYLRPGVPGRIEVRGRTQGDRAVFEIADNGRGIDPRDHSRIFDLFRRSGSQDQPGEGIGLAHVRALTYRLGGTIDVESELGRGSTFRIVLPLRLEPMGGTA